MTSAGRSYKRKGVSANEELPLIPEKRYFSISETARLCGVQPYILRFWEQEFSQLKPDKRRGNRRYYQYKDLVLVRQIRKLLYEEGFTIEGARTQLTSNLKAAAKTSSLSEMTSKILSELEFLLADLKATVTT